MGCPSLVRSARLTCDRGTQPLGLTPSSRSVQNELRLARGEAKHRPSEEILCAIECFLKCFLYPTLAASDAPYGDARVEIGCVRYGCSPPSPSALTYSFPSASARASEHLSREHLYRGEPVKFARRRQRLPSPCRQKRTTAEWYDPPAPFRSHAFAKRALHVKLPSFVDVTPTERRELLLRRQLSQ
ncbi:hypothetical protein HPB50_025781 [Hyalomma asiaticum]|uniref:Uncharacterized protein n=1 Tax=Hyalomma asiaticum TaxID=266040 RepID=A0ACB7RQG7_HYAAI|nr:hypothetical protein HPB50_025781 [Hyalomma asiaticum]